MHHLKGKKLLVMDRTALGACAVRRAKELGLNTIVANFYPEEDSPSKQIADEKVDIDISDIDAMVALIKERKVDGVFVGWTDSHLPFYAEICKQAGLPCIGTAEQFETLSNDKRMFKQACDKYGVPTVKEYHLDINLRREDLDKIEYPAMVKPADSSGSRGVRRCDTEEELVAYYQKLYEESASKKIICEKFMECPNEIFLNYTVQDGYASLSATFMCHHVKNAETNAAPAILHMYSSPYIQLYRDTVEPKFIEMLKGLGVKNAILSLQGFVDNGKFYFHETGYRMGGGRSYVFTERLNDISALDMMIEYAVSGTIISADLKEKDNPVFSKACCNYYVPLKPGKIKEISGLEEVRKMPQVLDIAICHKIGDEISKTNSLDSVVYRMHVMDDTAEALAHTLSKISSTLQILDEEGNEMQLEPLTFERALERTSTICLR
ncbi:MAG: hypothetical protein IJO92_04705 [Clostridia bacterium]|nr:hypothetical protein [Clostridia bacterium]